MRGLLGWGLPAVDDAVLMELTCSNYIAPILATTGRWINVIYLTDRLCDFMFRVLLLLPLLGGIAHGK